MKKFTCLALTLVLCLTLCVPAWATESLNAGAVNILDKNLEEIEEKSLEKYNILLKTWSRNPDYPDDRNADFPSFYGGAFIDDYKNLVIKVTEYNSSVEEYFADLIDLENVRFAHAECALIDLFEIQSQLNERIVSLDNENQQELVEGTGISIADNCVNLYVQADTDEVRVATAEDLSDIVADLEHVQIISRNMTNTADTVDSASTPKPLAQILLEPGEGIFIPGLDPADSYEYGIGFWAVDRSGNLGIVTAGHGTILSNIPAYCDDSLSTLFGTVMYPVLFDASVDGCFIRRENSNINPIRYVGGWDFNLVSNNYYIMAENASIYMRGPKTGCHSGVVYDVYFNPSAYKGDSYLQDAVLTTCYSRKGDSGGIVAGAGTSSNRYVVGIVSGGAFFENEETGEIIECMYYAKVAPILNELSLRVY